MKEMFRLDKKKIIISWLVFMMHMKVQIDQSYTTRYLPETLYKRQGGLNII